MMFSDIPRYRGSWFGGNYIILYKLDNSLMLSPFLLMPDTVLLCRLAISVQHCAPGIYTWLVGGATKGVLLIR